MQICISLNVQFTCIRNGGEAMRDSQQVWGRSGAGGSHGYSGWMREQCRAMQPHAL